MKRVAAAQVQAQRLAICKACPHAVPTVRDRFRRCEASSCRCFVGLLVIPAEAACPKGKWKTHQPEAV